MGPYRRESFSDVRAAGFTLIELIVTMFILSIVAGFAIYNFAGDRPGKRAKGAASMLYGEIQAYRMEALSKNTNYRFTLTEGGSTYTIEQVDSTGNPIKTVKTGDLQTEYPDIIFDAFPDTDTLGNPISESDSISFTNNRFTIRVNGRFSETGHLVIVPAQSLNPSDPKRTHQRLIVLSVVGYAKLYKWTDSGWK